MTWVKIDDGMPQNTKVGRLSDAGFRAYVLSICYCGANTTDGVIERSLLMLIPTATLKIAKELVAKGLWEDRPDGWYVHDYLEWNRSKAQIEADRNAHRENGRKGLASRYSKPPHEPPNGSLHGGLQQIARSAPSERSDPDHSEDLPEREQTEPSKPPSKPLPLPKKTTPTEEWAAEQREKFRGRLRDFDETLRFHMNGSYYRTCADKCTFLEKKLEAAAEREAALKGGANGRTATRGGNDAEHADQLAYFKSIAVQ